MPYLVLWLQALYTHIASDEAPFFFFNQKILIYVLLLHENLCCLMNAHNISFHKRNKKKYLSLYFICSSGVKWVILKPSGVFCFPAKHPICPVYLPVLHLTKVSSFEIILVVMTKRNFIQIYPLTLTTLGKFS